MLFRRFIVLPVAFSMFFNAASGFAQSTNKIEDQIQELLRTHPYFFLIFRVQPLLQVNSGYDSNALSRSGEEIGDYFYSVAPGANIALKLGSRAFLKIEEKVSFVYYKDLEQLRDIYDTTALEFVTGTYWMVATIHGSYVNKKGPLDSEFDIPAQQESYNYGANLNLAIASRFDLKPYFLITQSLYEEEEGTDPNLPPPPDNRILSFGTTLDYYYKPAMSIVAQVEGATTRFLEEDFADPDRYQFRSLGGVSSRGDQLAGSAMAGFAVTEGSPGNEDDIDLILDIEMNYQVRTKLVIGGILRRDRLVSAFSTDNFRVTTEGGIRGTVPLHSRLFLDGEFVVGKNDYNETLQGSEEIQNDTFRRLDSGLNLLLLEKLVLRGGISYLDRTSDTESLDKNRFTFTVGVRFDL